MNLTLVALTVCLGSTAVAAPMEQCSYKTRNPDGKITSTIEEPSDADGSNRTRFERVIKSEDASEEGWKGYHTFDVFCRPLDTEKKEWHLFVQSVGGLVSLISDLTESACYQGLYAADLHINAPSGSSWIQQSSDFARGQCFK